MAKYWTVRGRYGDFRKAGYSRRGSAKAAVKYGTGRYRRDRTTIGGSGSRPISGPRRF